MQVATHQALSSAAVITELIQPNHDNKAKLAKKNNKHETTDATSADSSELTQGNLARLLASCGDCV